MKSIEKLPPTPRSIVSSLLKYDEQQYAKEFLIALETFLRLYTNGVRRQCYSSRIAPVCLDLNNSWEIPCIPIEELNTAEHPLLNYRNTCKRFSQKYFEKYSRNEESLLDANIIQEYEIDPFKKLLPPEIFIDAIKLKNYELLSGKIYNFSEVLLNKKTLLLESYCHISKKLNNKYKRNNIAKKTQTFFQELDENDQKITENNNSSSRSLGIIFYQISKNEIQTFINNWFAFEAQLAFEIEQHFTDFLSPLFQAINSLDRMIISEKKETILPPPQDKMQKQITIRCIDTFCTAIQKLFLSYCKSAPVSLIRKNDYYPCTVNTIIVAGYIAQKNNENLKKQNNYEDYFFILRGQDLHKSDMVNSQLGKKQFEKQSLQLIETYNRMRTRLWCMKETLESLTPQSEAFKQTVSLLDKFLCDCQAYNKLLASRTQHLR